MVGINVNGTRMGYMENYVRGWGGEWDCPESQHRFDGPNGNDEKLIVLVVSKCKNLQFTCSSVR